MRISTTSCLCPFLVCLCFIQRCYGASHHVPAKVPTKNQTKLASGETEVHHRPKRGWIWNQFFVLEEHMGPDAQYVGKVRLYWTDCNSKNRNLLIPGNLLLNSLRGIFVSPLVYREMGCSTSKLFYWGRLPRWHCTCFFSLLMWKLSPHLWRFVCFIPVISMFDWIPLILMSKKMFYSL